MTFPTSTPSREGIDPAALLALLDDVDAHPGIEPHGLIVQRNGRRVLEGYWAPHRAGQARLVYSLSKTFTGTALALALGDGLLALDDPVTDHLPDLLEGAGERTRRMRVRHLASMASGHADETLLHAFVADPSDAVRGFFSIEPEHEPGEWFAYNQPPVLALSEILQRLTGERLVEQLRPRVLDPIGIGELRWHQYRPGVDLGFSGVYTDLDAIARLGQLYLDDGCWDGERLLPEGWVAQASGVRIDNSHRPEPDWSQGYGFQLWVGQHGYRGDGAFGQYMVVLPEQRTVIAFFSNTEPMQPFLDLLWDGVLPALGPAPDPAAAVAPDPEGDAAVAERAAHLSLPTAAERTGARPGADGAARGAFRRAPGPNHTSLTAVEVDDQGLVLHEGSARIRVPLAPGWTDVPGHHLATSAATRDDGGLEVDLVALATPHRMELRTFPHDGTYSAVWPLHPLFGLGLELELGAMRPPD